MAVKDKEPKPAVDYGHEAIKHIKNGRKAITKIYNKVKKDVKNEVAGAKRAVDIWTKPNQKKAIKWLCIRQSIKISIMTK